MSFFLSLTYTISFLCVLCVLCVKYALHLCQHSSTLMPRSSRNAFVLLQTGADVLRLTFAFGT